MLTVHNLTIQTAEKTILKNFSMEFVSGIYALVGPNGSGKTSLARAIMGIGDLQISGQIIWSKNKSQKLKENCENPNIENSKAEIEKIDLVEKIDLINLEIWERARLGIFLAFQNPPVVKGVSCLNLLKVAMENKFKSQLKSQNQVKLTSSEILKIIKKNSEILKINHLYRQKLENLSGGERKKLEILQLLCLEPSFAILDEVDSGLDADSVRLVAGILADYNLNPQNTLLVISHNPQFLQLLNPQILDIQECQKS